MAKVGFPHAAEYVHQNTLPEPVSSLWSSTVLFSCRRRHVTSHRSSSFTLLQSLAIEDSRDKPTYSVLLGQLFAFIGTNPDQAVGRVLLTTEEWHLTGRGGGPVTVTKSQVDFLLMPFRCPAAAFFWLHRRGGGEEILASRHWCTCGNCWRLPCASGAWHTLWVQWLWSFREDPGQLFLVVHTILTRVVERRSFQRWFLKPNHRQWYILMFSPKIFYFLKVFTVL